MKNVVYLLRSIVKRMSLVFKSIKKEEDHEKEFYPY